MFLADYIERVKFSLNKNVILALRVRKLLRDTIVEQLTGFVCRFFTIEFDETKSFTDTIACKLRYSDISDFASSAE